MNTLNFEMLKVVRGQLDACSALMHDESDADAKREIEKAIAVIDEILELNQQDIHVGTILEILANVIDALPTIAEFIERLK